MVVHDELGEVVVGELLPDCREHLIVEVFGQGRLARQEPKVLHVALITVVDDRVVVVVRVDDVIVCLVRERLLEESDVARAGSVGGWALCVAM